MSAVGFDTPAGFSTAMADSKRSRYSLQAPGPNFFLMRAHDAFLLCSDSPDLEHHPDRCYAARYPWPDFLLDKLGFSTGGSFCGPPPLRLPITPAIFHLHCFGENMYHKSGKVKSKCSIFHIFLICQENGQFRPAWGVGCSGGISGCDGR
jgi:hypothetical protein